MVPLIPKSVFRANRERQLPVIELFYVKTLDHFLNGALFQMTLPWLAGVRYTARLPDPSRNCETWNVLLT